MALKDIFNFWKKNNDPKTLSLGSVDGWPTEFLYRNSELPYISDKGSLKIGVFFACLRLLSNTMASLPVRIIKHTKDGGREVDTEHDQNRLISGKVSPLHTFNQFMSLMELYSNMFGDGFAVIYRDQFDRPIYWQLEHPQNVKTLLFTDADGIRYKFHKIHGKIYEDRDVIHYMNFSYDGIRGLGLVATHRSTLGMVQEVNNYGASFFSNSVHISGHISSSGKIEEPARKYIEETFNKRFGGEEKGKVPVLPFGLSFTPHNLTMPNADAQYLETNVANGLEVCRICGVQPNKVGYLGDTPYSTIEAQNTDFVNDTITQKCIRMEKELNAKIYRPDEMDRSVKFDVKGLLRGDIKTRTEFYKVMLGNAIFSPNEVRGLEDMSPYDGGDRRLAPLNMIPVDMFDQYLEILKNSKNGAKGESQES